MLAYRHPKPNIWRKGLPFVRNPGIHKSLAISQKLVACSGLWQRTKSDEPHRLVVRIWEHLESIPHSKDLKSSHTDAISLLGGYTQGHGEPRGVVHLLGDSEYSTGQDGRRGKGKDWWASQMTLSWKRQGLVGFPNDIVAGWCISTPAFQRYATKAHNTTETRARKCDFKLNNERCTM